MRGLHEDTFCGVCVHPETGEIAVFAVVDDADTIFVQTPDAMRDIMAKNLSELPAAVKGGALNAASAKLVSDMFNQVIAICNEADAIAAQKLSTADLLALYGQGGTA